MDLILINDSKLKIILTQDDMASYDLTCDSIDYDNTETRRAFWDILDAAKRQTGFDAASEKVYVQVYPSKSGGCEMYVTKLKMGGIAVSEKRPAMTVAGRQCEESVYRFSDLDTLCGACTYLQRGGYGGGSVWNDRQSGSYYLYIGSLGEHDGAVMSEYGDRSCTDASLWLREHCDCICAQSGVECMAALR